MKLKFVRGDMMTILYEGFKGDEPSIFLGVVLCVFGVVCLGLFLLALKDSEAVAAVLCFVGILVATAGALATFTSHRYPIVRATVSDTMPFKEVYENYELIDVEGDIYTFKVKDTNNE